MLFLRLLVVVSLVFSLYADAKRSTPSSNRPVPDRKNKKKQHRQWATVNDAKCSACIAVVDELSRAMLMETAQMSIDYRSFATRRLEKKGLKTGRVINYKMSELRAIEHLERMCRPMAEYAMVEDTNSDGKDIAYFQRVFGVPNYEDGHGIVGSITLNTAHATSGRNELRLWCDRLVEAHEDMFTDAIRGGTLDLDERMCVEISHSCKTAREMNSLPRVAKNQGRGHAARDIESRHAKVVTPEELEVLRQAKRKEKIEGGSAKPKKRPLTAKERQQADELRRRAGSRSRPEKWDYERKLKKNEKRLKKKRRKKKKEKKQKEAEL